MLINKMKKLLIDQSKALTSDALMYLTTGLIVKTANVPFTYIMFIFT